jgi:hypothetical protein
MHERDAIAAIRLVHEMGGHEDRHAVVAREVDQRAPKRVSRNRVDSRSWLVEDENRGLVQHCHGELKALLHTERQAVGPRIDDRPQIVAIEQLLNSRANLLFR